MYIENTLFIRPAFWFMYVVETVEYVHIGYIALFLITIAGFYTWHKRRLKEEMSQWKNNQSKEFKRLSEKRNQEYISELNSLKANNKELKKDIKKKSIELAKKAKENKSNNHILQKIKDRLEEIEKNPSLITKMKLKGIRRLLDQYLEIDDNTFEIQIDEIHQEFFKTLKKEYPDLTTYDLRLSAYLKMGLNTKEIAEIVNVLPSSINVSRSRLRKKLNLEAGEDLFEFMNQLESEKSEV